MGIAFAGLFAVDAWCAVDVGYTVAETRPSIVDVGIAFVDL